jgi:hypothetical protein
VPVFAHGAKYSPKLVQRKCVEQDFCLRATHPATNVSPRY